MALLLGQEAQISHRTRPVSVTQAAARAICTSKVRRLLAGSVQGACASRSWHGGRGSRALAINSAVIG
jgi:hypothetical protein